MTVAEIVLAAVVGWVLLCLAAARFCSMNTLSEEHERAVEEMARRSEWEV